MLGLTLGALAAGLLLAARLHELLHLLQLEHYEIGRLRLWIARRGDRLPLPETALFSIGAASLTVATVASPAVLAVGALLLTLSGGPAVRRLRRPQAKPLVFTPRARRTFALTAVLAAAAVAGAALAGSLAGPIVAVAAAGAVATIAYVYADLALGSADRLLAPLRALETRHFVRRARHRLADVAPAVVAITGSYGKTTTKACVAAVAELRGAAYPTPASFNSLLGVVRAINEGLHARHRTFVVEMGAYRAGDIAQLCDLVAPKIGILTAIGPAHLERFGSLEAIELAKGELAAALPPDGTLITRADDEACRRAAKRMRGHTILFSPAEHPDSTLFAENIEIAEGRTTFILCVRGKDGIERAPVRSRLLGRHNVANLLAAAAYGVSTGLAVALIARALAGVEPPTHRLAPIVNRAAGVVVIDDAYNSNPDGASAALEVLAAHPAERRLLVTPGMVELGDRELEENHRFGVAAAKVCDLVVLVGGERTAPIRAGLEQEGFPAESTVVVPDSAAAAALLGKTTRNGDVVLFENDLPDLYSRA